MSFRGIVISRSYRIDCDTSHLIPGHQRHSDHQSLRHIVALSVRGIQCPNTAMVYCKYRSHECIPLGLIPGSVAALHNFSAKSSARSGNVYFVNCASSSITIERINTDRKVSNSAGDSGVCGVANELLLPLPVVRISTLTRCLLSSSLSRGIVRVNATLVAVMHAFIQYQCMSCQCTVVDGQCRQTCPSKKSVLNTDARYVH